VPFWLATAKPTPALHPLELLLDSRLDELAAATKSMRSSAARSTLLRAVQAGVQLRAALADAPADVVSDQPAALGHQARLTIEAPFIRRS
jgi:hypothetical protein